MQQAEDWLVKFHWDKWKGVSETLTKRHEVETYAKSLGWTMPPKIARDRRIKATNEINVIYPYRTKQGTWVYDDEDLGVYSEAFVMGSSEVIDYLVGKDCNKFTAILSKNPIPGFDARLMKVEGPEDLKMEGWYELATTGMQHWLCGCVLDYFEGYPDNIYVKIKK